MKKILLILLALITVMSLVACDKGAAVTTPNTSENKNPVENENKEVNIKFVENGSSTLYIVLPESEQRLSGYARDRLRFTLKDMMGVNILSGTASDCEYEIHVGNTGAEAAAILDSLAEDEFAVKTIDKKIYIVAKNEPSLYDAAVYFIDTYLTSKKHTKSDDKNLTLTSYIDDVQKIDKTTMHYILGAGGLNLTATVEAHTTIDNQYYYTTPQIHARQGGCYVGRFYYQLYKDIDDKIAVIAKKDLETGKVIYSKVREDLGHGNDMTYNPITNEIIVPNGKHIVVFDAHTLEEKRTVSSSVSAGGRITYSPERDTYLFGSFKFMRSDLKTYSNRFFNADPSNKDYTNQGMASDDCFIYSLIMTPKGGSKYLTHVAVYDWSGNYVGFINVEIEGLYEPENISVVDGVLYIGTCTPHPIVTLNKLIISLPQ